MVDTTDLKSVDLYGCEGSSPSSPTTHFFPGQEIIVKSGATKFMKKHGLFRNIHHNIDNMCGVVNIDFRHFSENYFVCSVNLPGIKEIAIPHFFLERA